MLNKTFCIYLQRKHYLSKIMKKLFFSLSCMFITLSAALFTSCDDVDTSMTLSGEWTGDFGMYYTVEYRGELIECSAMTDLCFVPDYEYATHGWGKQVDWYSDERCPYEKEYHKFDWRIRNGVIYIKYRHEHDLDVAIYDYMMDNVVFEGRFEGSKTRFRLRKISDYYDWDAYSSDYQYYERHYGPGTRAMNDEPGSILRAADGSEVKIVKRGNHFAEGRE